MWGFSSRLGEDPTHKLGFSLPLESPPPLTPPAPTSSTFQSDEAGAALSSVRTCSRARRSSSRKPSAERGAYAVMPKRSTSSGVW